MVAVAALGLRCPRLEDRPMHVDEAVHAVILGEMLETGVYRYNPQDSHGPLLYDLSYPLLRVLGVRDLAGMEAWHLRLVSALVGAATILSLAPWAKEFGAGAVVTAGVLFAGAAPFVFYQRYFIHEGLFVLLTLLCLRCLWSWRGGQRSVALAVATGAVSALLFATKETAPLVFLSAALGFAGVRRTQKTPPPFRPGEGARSVVSPVGWALLSFTVVFVLFYSSFGTNLHGLADFVSAQFRFARRAGGEGHEKPWWTYLSWLLRPNFYVVPWSGWIILGLGVSGAVRGWRQPLVRFLVFFTLALGGAYSLIPYKTPWLEIDFLAPAVLLAGVGAADVFRRAGKSPPVLVLLAVLALLGLGRETRQLCFAHADDARNPLAYSPTARDVGSLAARVAQLERNDPPGTVNVVQVISADYWPLPWYLRRLPPVGYWSTVPPAITGNIVITSPDLLPAVQAQTGPGWDMEYFGLRSDVLVVVLSKPAAHE